MGGSSPVQLSVESWPGLIYISFACPFILSQHSRPPQQPLPALEKGTEPGPPPSRPPHCAPQRARQWGWGGGGGGVWPAGQAGGNHCAEALSVCIASGLAAEWGAGIPGMLPGPQRGPDSAGPHIRTEPLRLPVGGSHLRQQSVERDEAGQAARGSGQGCQGPPCRGCSVPPGCAVHLGGHSCRQPCGPCRPRRSRLCGGTGAPVLRGRLLSAPGRKG